MIKKAEVSKNDSYDILYVYWEQFNNKVTNTEAQIGKIFRTPNIGRNLLVLIKEKIISSFYLIIYREMSHP